ncbi:hypothetical protein SMGD1_1063 [Sulfurimonas gotlandica GD1]|uniref:Uncharacterized protein n=1 Tax=Sulfurimonas gotlandica (strain DSM 19862 / JCM 16533 / GD1) TaxID=929558 RepID=H1FYG1_SULGG|nr:hypothetical protein [Sulfurimonas gotlandica]EHP29587.1 hypothetical protein SMGD1_1063 [Sulfurimonas gotlandica GD1]
MPKYIASKNNESVIFEFQKDGKPIRKWVKKEDIILLTDNKDYFLETVKHFKDIEATQQKLVDEAHEQLNKSIEAFTETMNSEIDEYSEIRDSSDVPCILKDL